MDLVLGSKLTYFKCDDRLTRYLGGWWPSKLTRFLNAGRKALGFSVSIEIDSVTVGVDDIDLFSV